MKKKISFWKFLLSCIFISQFFSYEYSFWGNTIVATVVALPVSILLYGVYDSFLIKKVSKEKWLQSKRFNVNFCLLVAFYFFSLDAIGRGVLKGYLSVGGEAQFMIFVLCYLLLGIIIGSQSLRRNVSIGITMFVAISMLVTFRTLAYFLFSPIVEYLALYGLVTLYVNSILEGLVACIGILIIREHKQKIICFTNVKT